MRSPVVPKYGRTQNRSLTVQHGGSVHLACQANRFDGLGRNARRSGLRQSCFKRLLAGRPPAGGLLFTPQVLRLINCQCG